MEFQIRNWLYFTWLSGDTIVEQHIHSLDKMMWADEGRAAGLLLFKRRPHRPHRAPLSMATSLTISARPMSGKMAPKASPMPGSGLAKSISALREVSDFVYGTDGVAALQSHVITGKNPGRARPTSTPALCTIPSTSR